MLEQMREQTGSLIIWVLFAIIIAAFVLFFGSPSDSLGCGSTNDYAIEVDDEAVSVHSWRFAYNGIPLVYGNVPGDQRRPLTLEFLLQREILAQEAEKLDMHISEDVINKAIPQAEFYMLGNKLDGTRFYFPAEEGKPQFFSFESLTNLAKGTLGLPNLTTFRREQRREMMAYLMKQEIIRSAYISEEEARTAFIQNNTKISASYVKFDVSKYRSAAKLTEATVNEYIAGHDEELKAEWEQVKPRWETDKARVKARIIKIAKAPSAPPAAPAPTLPDGEVAAAGEKPVDAPVPDAPVIDAPVIDAGRIAIDAAREKLVAGASFADVAAEVSQDRTAPLGGAIGWRAADSLGFGQEVVEGTKGLEVDKVSAVIETAGNYFLVLIEAKSEKGLTFDEKKFDMAIKAAPASAALALAKADAEAALASAQTTALGELFPAAAAAPPSFDFNSLSPGALQNMSPEQREQIEQLIKSSAPAGKTGAIVEEGAIQYAQLGGEEAKPVAAVPAKPVAAAEPPVPATDKPVAATDKPVAVAPALAAPVTTDAEPPAVASAPLTGTPGVTPPSLKNIKETTRNGDFIAGIGRSSDLAADLFGTLGVGDMGAKVYKVSDKILGDGFVVVQLTDRTEADMEKFADEAADIQAALAQAKGGQRVQEWVLSRCLALKKAGTIKINPAMLKGSNQTLLGYEPCSLMAQQN